MKFLPGDFIVCKNTTFILSNLIAWLTKEEGERGYSHAFVVITEGDNVTIIEGVFPRARRVSLQEALKDAEYAMCLRPIGATPVQRRQIVTEACRHVGNIYGVQKLPRMLVGLFLKSEAIQEIEISPRLPQTCTGIPGQALQAAGLSWGEDPASLQAAEMLVHARAHPEMWQVSEVLL